MRWDDRSMGATGSLRSPPRSRPRAGIVRGALDEGPVPVVARVRGRAALRGRRPHRRPAPAAPRAPRGPAASRSTRWPRSPGRRATPRRTPSAAATAPGARARTTSRSAAAARATRPAGGAAAASTRAATRRRCPRRRRLPRRALCGRRALRGRALRGAEGRGRGLHARRRVPRACVRRARGGAAGGVCGMRCACGRDGRAARAAPRRAAQGRKWPWVAPSQAVAR